MSKVKVTLSFCSSDILVEYLETGNEYEYSANDEDRENLKPCESKICDYHIENDVLIIDY